MIKNLNQTKQKQILKLFLKFDEKLGVFFVKSFGHLNRLWLKHFSSKLWNTYPNLYQIMQNELVYNKIENIGMQ